MPLVGKSSPDAVLLMDVDATYQYTFTRASRTNGQQ